MVRELLFQKIPWKEKIKEEKEINLTINSRKKIDRIAIYSKILNEIGIIGK